MSINRHNTKIMEQNTQKHASTVNWIWALQVIEFTNRDEPKVSLYKTLAPPTNRHASASWRLRGRGVKFTIHASLTSRAGISCFVNPLRISLESLLFVFRFVFPALTVDVRLRRWRQKGKGTEKMDIRRRQTGKRPERMLLNQKP